MYHIQQNVIVIFFVLSWSQFSLQQLFLLVWPINALFFKNKLWMWYYFLGCKKNSQTKFSTASGVNKPFVVVPDIFWNYCHICCGCYCCYNINFNSSILVNVLFLITARVPRSLSLLSCYWLVININQEE